MGHIQGCFDVDVVKIDIKKYNVVSTLSNVVQINVEIDSVDSTLFNVAYSNLHKHNVDSLISTLIWRCATSRHHINLKSTLKQLWNVCWVVTTVSGSESFAIVTKRSILVPQGKGTPSGWGWAWCNTLPRWHDVTAIAGKQVVSPLHRYFRPWHATT